jgi:hypothetical protein
MNALILKSANHLYKLFKVYATMALLGALAAIVIQIVLAEPMVLIAAFMVVSAASIIVLLLAQSHRGSGQRLNQQRSHELENERPPILPESLMIVSLPADFADEIIGDLRDEFYHLRSKYGRYSAVTWYSLQSVTIFIKATALHCGLSYGKSLTQLLNKQSH